MIFIEYLRTTFLRKEGYQLSFATESFDIKAMQKLLKYYETLEARLDKFLNDAISP